jgi:hypothetical protein
MFNYTSYCDESGHSEDPTLLYAGMAGFVAPAGAWEVFEGEWKELLRNAGFSQLHMKDFAHSEGEFARWKGKEHEAERQAFLGRALEIIRNTNATPVGAVVSLRDFASLTEGQKKSFLNPYYVAFQTCTRGSAIHALFETPEEKVAMVYSYNEEYGANEGGRAHQLWEAMKKSIDWRYRMGSYASNTPVELCPLQAADFLAYELCHEFENQIKRPKNGMRFPLTQMLQMVKSPIPKIVLFDRKELLRRVKESRFLDQTGVEEVAPDQMVVAASGMTRWMMERAGIKFSLTDLEL